MASDNVKLVQDMYAAYGRGDVAAIVGNCAEDVAWESVGPNAAFAGYGARKGRPAVREFFGVVGQHCEFDHFTPKDFHAVGDKVFVLGSFALRFRASRKEAASDFVHVFTIKDGKVADFREFTDTAAMMGATREGDMRALVTARPNTFGNPWQPRPSA